MQKAVLAAVIIVAIIVSDGCIRSILQDGRAQESRFSIPKRCREENMVGGQSTHIPLKVNTAGVIPVIFASVSDAVPGYDCSTCLVKATETGIGSKILDWY